MSGSSLDSEIVLFRSTLGRASDCLQLRQETKESSTRHLTIVTGYLSVDSYLKCYLLFVNV